MNQPDWTPGIENGQEDVADTQWDKPSQASESQNLWDRATEAGGKVVTPVLTGMLGVYGVRLVDKMWDRFFSKEETTPTTTPPTPAKEAHTSDMERLIRSNEQTVQLVRTSQQDNNKLFRAADKRLTNHEDRIIKLEERVDGHDEQLESLSEITTRQEGLIDGIKKDLNAHLEQPGSMFYLSTEFQMSALVEHFGKLTNAKDIDKFIRGEKRTKVLAMAKLRKEQLAKKK